MDHGEVAADESPLPLGVSCEFHVPARSVEALALSECL